MRGTPPPTATRAQRQITWAGWGFAIGSALFMAGVPLSLSTSLSPAVAGWTYFLGSIFFTGAATLQTLASLRPDDEGTAPWAQWNAGDRANLVAAAVQWFGTIEFNVTTLRAALEAASRHDYTTQAVWAPDALGSILFLVSSAIALAPEVHRRRLSRVRDRAWAIAAVNMLGSILFGASAIGAWTTSSGELVSLWWANVGTFAGGVCFLIGAILMLPFAPSPQRAPA
jgi:hypothetical protein